MKRALIIAMLIAASAATAYAAQGGVLSGTELRQAVSGKTVFLRQQGIELPITYRSNGTMSGRLKAFIAALASPASPTDVGRWWVSNNQLCQRWSQWLDGKSYCYTLKRQGGTVFWTRNDGRTGTARIGG